jgi:2-polyprenyl-6-methoxyphenol hydroxylase-like FAD-dependent oxidoreductase
MKNVDVLIAGAGPTGLTLACDLVRRGLTVALLDQAPAPSETSRAITVHARTLELLEPLALAAPLLERGKTVGGVTVWAGGEPIVKAELDELDSRFKHVLLVSEAALEALLADKLAELGGSVERGAKLVSFRQDGTGVTAQIERGEGDVQPLRAAWLVGCDGKDSTVRRALELEFESEATDDDLAIADVKVAWDMRDDRVHAFFAETGVVVCFPMGGDRYRVIASLPPEAREKKADPTIDDLQTLFALHTSANARLSDATWLTRLRTRSRQVQRYRDDRVLLAGDAAHTHGPLGGQGINAGIQDAVNLGWKLALVHRGDARGLLLDTYHEERHAAGRAALKAADVAAKIASVKSTPIKIARAELGRFLGSLEVVQQRVAKEVADLSTSYERSSIVHEDKTSLLNARLGSASGGDTPTIGSVREFAAGPAAGQRAPDGKATLAGQGGTRRLYELLDGRKQALLLFDGRSSSEEGYGRLKTIAEEVRKRYDASVASWVVTPQSARPQALPADLPVLLDPEGDLEKRYAASTECVYLVRPDFHVGYRSQPADLEKLLDYLDALLRKS